MLEQMSSRQLSEWLAFFELEHLGAYDDFRGDLRSAIVAATIANSNRGRNASRVKLEAFMPTFDRPTQTAEELHARLKSLTERRAAAAGDSPKKRSSTDGVNNVQAESRARPRR